MGGCKGGFFNLKEGFWLSLVNSAWEKRQRRWSFRDYPSWERNIGIKAAMLSLLQCFSVLLSHFRVVVKYLVAVKCPGSLNLLRDLL